MITDYSLQVKMIFAAIQFNDNSFQIKTIFAAIQFSAYSLQIKTIFVAIIQFSDYSLQKMTSKAALVWRVKKCVWGCFANSLFAPKTVWRGNPSLLWRSICKVNIMAAICSYSSLLAPLLSLESEGMEKEGRKWVAWKKVYTMWSTGASKYYWTVCKH